METLSLPAPGTRGMCRILGIPVTVIEAPESIRLPDGVFMVEPDGSATSYGRRIQDVSFLSESSAAVEPLVDFLSRTR